MGDNSPFPIEEEPMHEQNRFLMANAIRFLSLDAVQQANSGHPGAPMGMADIAQVLWCDFLKHNPSNPNWVDRDRFVLSNGHASMMLYSLLHLTGYDLKISDLKNFRQLHSRTPGHPEYGITPGVETTTGPLGQGIANAVGFALGERILAEQFNRDSFPLVDHHTYVFLGDGCLMEGISHEACSFAGTFKLSKLIAFWDDNKISIDGHVEGWFTEDVPARFKSYGWHVIANVDGHNPDAIKKAILAAKAETEKPTIICCRTTIAFGSPNFANTADAHGSPLGPEEIVKVREQLEWPYPPFEIPEALYAAWDARPAGAEHEAQWNQLFLDYQAKHPELAAEFVRHCKSELPNHWEERAYSIVSQAQQETKPVATRKSSQWALNQLHPLLPEFIGGSADLTGSNCTNTTLSKTITPNDINGNYIHYGVREFGMAAIMNGLALHNGFIPYGGTFLVFTDYARNAIRLSALMHQRVIYVLTHDSIGLGEDGPTHQPIEHAAMLRMTPNLSVWRPCDHAETAMAWKMAIERQDGPTCILLTRQNLPQQSRDAEHLALISRGGYILKQAENPQALIIATGSEVSIAMDAAAQLESQGLRVRVVSMPCVDQFEKQPASYRDAVLPPHVRARVAIEAASADYWYKFVGLDGRIVGLTCFGESAPAADIYKALGITVQAVIDAVNAVVKIK